VNEVQNWPKVAGNQTEEKAQVSRTASDSNLKDFKMKFNVDDTDPGVCGRDC
jgi:hypothetical protein